MILGLAFVAAGMNPSLCKANDANPEKKTQGFFRSAGRIIKNAVAVPVNAAKKLFYRSKRKVHIAKENIEDKARDVKNNVKETLLNANSTVQEKAGEIKEDLQGAANKVKKDVQDVRPDLQDKVYKAKESIKDEAAKIQKKASDQIGTVKNKINNGVETMREAFERWDKNMEDKAARQEVMAAREKLLTDLAVTRDDLPWINQEVVVSDFINFSSNKQSVRYIKDLLPDYLRDLLQDTTIDAADKKELVDMWVKSFLIELEYEEGVLDIIEKELNNLLDRAQSDDVSGDQFVKDIHAELERTTGLKVNMDIFFQAVETMSARVIDGINK